MTGMSDLPERLPDLLARLASGLDVPGAALAVLTPQGSVTSAFGVLSLATGVEATADTVFQIGSISKVFTATLVLQLVDDGLLDLDEPVVRYLPGFRVADEVLSRRVTARHLLSHTSGIDGDFFLDTGRGDDAVERYVAAMSGLRAVCPLGEAFSYSNSGYAVLGLLVATLRGQSWDLVLRDRLLAPLGMASAGTLPEEALLHRAAVGHVKPDEVLRPATVWGVDRSAGPAGGIHCTAEDLLAFALLHLTGGVAPDGARLLSSEAAAAMRQPQVDTRDGKAVGLGWQLSDWGTPVLGHDGGTIGQLAFLRVLPEKGSAIALLTNGPEGAVLFAALVHELANDLGGLTLTSAAHEPQPALPEDAGRWVGRYESVGTRYDIAWAGSDLTVTATSLLPASITQGAPPHTAGLQHLRDDVYLASPEPGAPPIPLHFLTFSDGTSGLALGSRITPRTEEGR